MKKKVFRKFRFFLAIAMAVSCLAGVPSIKTLAAGQNFDANEEVTRMEGSFVEVPEGYFDALQNARAVLTQCSINIDFSSDGMKIIIFTGTTQASPVVGVKDIKVEQKVWYGWKEVAYAEGGELTDTNMIGYSVTYKDAIKGETYRVSCTHYADLTYDGVESYTEGYNNTGAFVFTY